MPSPHKTDPSPRTAEQPYSHSHASDPLLSRSSLTTPVAVNGTSVGGGLASTLPTTAARAGSTAPLHPTTTTATTVLSSAQRQYLARQSELQRFRRLFRRLAWKANSLTHWSHRALSLAQEHQTETLNRIQSQHGHPTTGHALPGVIGPRASLGRYEMVIDPIEAERQFKIDFFEFYAVLERGLICLLGVWGIVITSTVPPGSTSTSTAPLRTYTSPASSRPPHPQDATSSGAIIGDSRTFHGAAHRFHANVLDALDHPSNPLHDVLGAGSGDVRAYIGVAKEFRNKWKDVEQRPDDSFLGNERAEDEWDRGKVKRYEKVLQDLRLDELLGAVLAGLEEAGRRAEAEVGRLEKMLGNTATVDAKNRRAYDGDFDMLDAPFEVAMAERVEHDYDYEMEL